MTHFFVILFIITWISGFDKKKENIPSYFPSIKKRKNSFSPQKRFFMEWRTFLSFCLSSHQYPVLTKKRKTYLPISLVSKSAKIDFLPKNDFYVVTHYFVILFVITWISCFDKKTETYLPISLISKTIFHVVTHFFVILFVITLISFFDKIY